MSGYFKKAPLVFMSATLRTQPLPRLDQDQWLKISQELYRLGLTVPAEGEVHELEVSAAFAASPAPTSATISRHSRKGFFSSDRQEGIIFDVSSIEWKCTKYLKYQGMCERFGGVLSAIIRTVDLFALVQIEEVTLSYADLIFPFKGRQLHEYFAKGEAALPINMLASTNQPDLQRVGHVQFTRVVSPIEKIYISLEQLPLFQGKIIKFLPEVLSEPSVDFHQFIQLRPEWSYPGVESQNEYALLVTQASMLKTFNLSEFNVSVDANSLHELVSNEFKGIIHEQNCHADWEFIEE